MDYEITLTSSAGMQTGDVIEMPMRLTAWQRFLIWLARPTRWPPATAQKRMVVTKVSSNTALSAEHAGNYLDQ